jgi:hypothetical protein
VGKQWQKGGKGAQGSGSQASGSQGKGSSGPSGTSFDDHPEMRALYENFLKAKEEKAQELLNQVALVQEGEEAGKKDESLKVIMEKLEKVLQEQQELKAKVESGNFKATDDEGEKTEPPSPVDSDASEYGLSAVEKDLYRNKDLYLEQCVEAQTKYDKAEEVHFKVGNRLAQKRKAEEYDALVAQEMKEKKQKKELQEALDEKEKKYLEELEKMREEHSRQMKGLEKKIEEAKTQKPAPGLRPKSAVKAKKK